MRLLGTVRPGVADALTLGNASCGVGATLVVVTLGTGGDALRLVVVLLLAGTVLDVLDGAAARRWGSSSLGRPLDGLADAVTFGLMPAVALGALGLDGDPGVAAVAVVAGVVIFSGSALLRLADFCATRCGDPHFTGLPSPLAAVAAFDIAFLSPPPLVIALGLAGLGAQMVSPLHYPVQGGVIAALSLGGWAFGAAGLSGLVDARIPALATLAFIVVVIPTATAIEVRSRVPVNAPTC